MCEHSNFFSVENLVELGISMSLARQMVSCFNENMAIVMTPPDYTIRNVHISMDGKDVGPLDEKDIIRLLGNHKLSAKTLAWMPGMPKWLPIEQIPPILKIIALATPAMSANQE